MKVEEMEVERVEEGESWEVVKNEVREKQHE